MANRPGKIVMLYGDDGKEHGFARLVEKSGGWWRQRWLVKFITYPTLLVPREDVMWYAKGYTMDEIAAGHTHDTESQRRQCEFCISYGNLSKEPAHD